MTGSTTGIGQAIADRLRSEGHRVLGVQRRGPGTRADLADYRRIPAAWQRALDELGCPPELVVLNAGNCHPGRLIDMSVDECVATIALNLLAPLLFAREVLGTWCHEGTGGHLIFIGSQAALPGAKHPGEVAYTAAKGGIHSIVGPLATEYGPETRVNGIAPGNVETEAELALVAALAQDSGRAFEDLRAEIGARSPIRRWIRPAEVAEAVLFLDSCHGMSGAILNLSGGSSAH